MKSAASTVLYFALLGALGCVFANVEDEHAYDPELIARLLGSEEERAARKLSGSMTVPKQMYKELIYKEKLCEDYVVVDIDGNIVNFQMEDDGTVIRDEFGDPVRIQLGTGDDLFELGYTATFKCELYEEDIRFGQYGGRRVGDTYWGCRVASFVNLQVTAAPFIQFEEPVWDCTIVDYIGREDDDDVNDPLADANPLDSLRNEGLTLFLFDPNIRTGPLWNRYHSHEGLFATTGGVGIGKGARGQVEIKWDDYSMTWFHIYTVEVWNLEQEKYLKRYPSYW